MYRRNVIVLAFLFPSLQSPWMSLTCNSTKSRQYYRKQSHVVMIIWQRRDGWSTSPLEYFFNSSNKCNCVIQYGNFPGRQAANNLLKINLLCFASYRESLGSWEKGLSPQTPFLRANSFVKCTKKCFFRIDWALRRPAQSQCRCWFWEFVYCDLFVLLFLEVN